MSINSLATPQSHEQRAIAKLLQQAKLQYGKSAPGEPFDPVVFSIGQKGTPGYKQFKLSEITPEIKKELGELEKVSESLEGVMLKDLFSKLQKGQSKEGFGGQMGDMANDMFNQTMADSLSQNRGVGITEMLFRQLGNRILNQRLTQKTKTTDLSA